MSEVAPNLDLTKAALAEYDRQIPGLQLKLRDAQTNAEVLKCLNSIELQGEAVGAAFGKETRAFNNPETCRQCVRPGPAVPAPGQQLSFVRRMVRDHG